jgi:DNA-binding NarL/FixJ family response regulator
MGIAVHSPCAPRITVAIADDQPVMREGLARLIGDECDLAVSGSAASGAELRALVKTQPPCVLVMDLMLREADGLVLVKDVAEFAPALRIVVFTLEPAATYAARCLRAGAHAYVGKLEPVTTLLRAIRDAARGDPAAAARLSGGALVRTGGKHEGSEVVAKLTDRELQVFRLAGMALPTRDIAAKLGVSVKTVETHRENIKHKLDLHSHGELLARAALWVRQNGGDWEVGEKRRSARTG